MCRLPTQNKVLHQICWYSSSPYLQCLYIYIQEIDNRAKLGWLVAFDRVQIPHVNDASKCSRDIWKIEKEKGYGEPHDQWKDARK